MARSIRSNSINNATQVSCLQKMFCCGKAEMQVEAKAQRPKKKQKKEKVRGSDATQLTESYHN